ncbi:MAG: aryl-sulfate sulfohydrolase, partial [Gammaproteobacteria bacterium]
PLHAKKEWVEKYEGKHPYGGQSVPAYGAMVSYMDDCVGRVLDKLDELGLTENTVIFFVSDNGGQIVATSNSPLRGQKGNLYEGGIRVPLIVKWPKKVKPGSIVDVPLSVVDFYPTLAEITGANIPEDKLIDGESMVPLLTDKGVLKREAIFWHLPSYNGNGLSNSSLWQTPGGAIRRGKWKLIEGFEDGSLQLFNLESDIGETMNLSSQYPGMANELLEELKAWQKSTNAPIPGEDNSQFEESSRDWISRANTRNLKETERLTVIR